MSELSLTIDPMAPGRDLAHFWKALGCDYLFWHTRTGQADYLLDRMAQTGAIRHLRCHYTLSDESYHARRAIHGKDQVHFIPDETANLGLGIYSEDERGRPQYCFTLMDEVFDRWVRRGLKPYVELDYPPEALAGGPRHASSDQPPIKDFNRWDALISRTVEHLLDRYGPQEVRTWHFETWNEPDQMRSTHYLRLFDHTIAAVKRVDPQLKVGGHATYSSAIRPVLEHLDHGVNHVTGRAEHDCDFLSHHAYALSAHDRAVFPWLFPWVSNILQSVHKFFLDQRLVFGKTRYTLHLNECGLCGQYAWTKDDWTFLNIHNTHYAGLFWVKLIVGLIRLADHPWCQTPDLVAFWGAHEITGKMFSGNRSLATGGPLLKPVWSAFEMLARLGHTLLDVLDDPLDMAVGGLATRREDGALVLLLYNFEEGVQPNGSARSLTITLIGTMEGEVRHYLLDAEHGNTYTAWQQMGQPAEPTKEHLTELRRHEALCQTAPPAVQRQPKAIELRLTLPAQSLNLIEIVPSED